MKIRNILSVALVSVGLSACAATMPPVSVTRFHQAPASAVPLGSITIQRPEYLAGSADQISLEQGTYNAAVMRELRRIGYSDAAGSTSAFVARVAVEQERITSGGRRSPVSVGVGGNTGGYGSGVGVGIGLNLGGAPKDIISTQLSVRISRRADNQAVWEGRALVEAKDGSPASQPALAASKLAEALFRDFPGESGATIRVP